jgi:Right handed beta helix region
MNYFDLYSSYPDRTIAAAWDSQVKEADNAPWLTDCGGELFARFAACYAELRSLRRSARRALQRQLARSSELAAVLPEYLQQGGRRLQHRMAWSLAGAALLLALGQGVATAATITVTTNNPNIASDGQCSLIEAIVNANNDAATHPDCAAGSGADTIVLPANARIELTSPITISYGRYGLLITSRITIEGNGATIARPENAPNFALIRVDMSISEWALGGGVTLDRVNLHGSSGGWGALFNISNLTIKNSTISGSSGRGLINWSGASNILNSTISKNSGSGVLNTSTITVQNSTISGNTSGGIFNSGGDLTIINSTISGNSADQGGGVFNSEYYLYGTPGTVRLRGTLIAGNQAAIGAQVANGTQNLLNSINASDFNLFGSNGNAGVSGFTPGPTDIVPSVPLANILSPLQNNGGLTQTHALVDGSPALDAGDPGGCRDSQGTLLSSDQRGFVRHVDSNNDGTARCDIGAFEAKAVFVVAAVLPSSRSVQINSPATAFATIINAGQALATGCTISRITDIPATFTFQTTDPATNQVIGAPNALVDIPAGAAQSFIFALTPNAPIDPTDVQFSFECSNANPAPIRPGVNTFLFSASLTPVADIVALAATLNNDGIVNIPGTNGTGVFAVATVNVGAGDTITVLADTGDAILPVNILLCQTNPKTAACLSSPESGVSTTILTNETPTFGLFAAAAGDVSFVPETNRIFVRFQDSGGVTRGLTSVAVRTQ